MFVVVLVVVRIWLLVDIVQAAAAAAGALQALLLRQQ
jgi:hypothetical protein